MNRRIATLVVVVAALVAVACVDMSAPKGALSISSLVLPSPSVVVGDTMRDSVGVAAPLRVIAFDADDKPIADVAAQFFITDSLAVGHLDKGNVVVGDKQGSLHIIGQVSGIQTLPVTLPVTVKPTVFALGAKVDTLTVPFANATDTTRTSTKTVAIPVTLKGLGDTAAVGFVVKYALTSAPATKSGSTLAAVSLVADDASRIVSGVDTTDGSGASRLLLVRSPLLADQALQSGQTTDSAVVTVSTTYKGVPVSGSPIRVVVPIKVKIGF